MNSKKYLCVSALCAAWVVAGCAGNPVATGEVGRVKVTYTTERPDGSWLKEKPTEVKLVARATTQREVGKQVALSVLMLALGGFSMNPFEKGELAGDEIELAGDRSNIRNPIPDEFVARLNERIDEAVKADAELSQRSWKRPIEVAGGNSRLMYETLTDGEESFRLALSLVVYKRKEDLSLFSTQKQWVDVDCSASSEKPLPLDAWSAQGYGLVKTELSGYLDRCEKKVLAALPDLLRQ